MLGEIVSKILPLMKDQSTVLYLNFVKGVDDVTDINKGNVNVNKYTGQMKTDIRQETAKQFCKAGFQC